MKLINIKTVLLLSDGSLCFSSKNYLNSKQILVYKKDNKNFNFNKKKTIKKTYSEFSSEYKKKYLI
jgi:hypothetical protein